jgi:lipopolysaccharide export system permease protein
MNPNDPQLPPRPTPRKSVSIKKALAADGDLPASVPTQPAPVRQIQPVAPPPPKPEAKPPAKPPAKPLPKPLPKPRATEFVPPPVRESILGKLGIKTIDRYVLGMFLRNYLLALFVLLGLYIVLDMVFNFDEFVEVSGAEGVGNVDGALAVVKSIASYYFFQSFRLFNVLAGVVPVVAAAFTFMRMSRFNETSALLAAGVSLKRLAAPVIFASFVLSAVLVPINQELIVPRFMDKLTRERGTPEYGGITRLSAMPDAQGGLVFAGLYSAPKADVPARIDYLYVLSRREGMQYLLSADVAEFDRQANHWRLTNGRESPTGTGQIRDQGRQLDAWDGGVSPESIALFRSAGKFTDLLSSARINEMIQQGSRVGIKDLLRVQATRYSGIFLNVLLVILTIPCVLTREPMQLRTATFKVFALVGACMAMVFLSHHFAGRPPSDPYWIERWAWLVALIPIGLIFAVAIDQFARIKT